MVFSQPHSESGAPLKIVVKYSRRYSPPLGVSLIELMITLILSLVLLTAGVGLFTTSKRNIHVVDGLTELQENTRYATELLTRLIRIAGYRTPPTVGSTQDFTTLAVSYPSGAEYTNGSSGGGQNNSDTLIVRFQGSGNGAGVPDNSIMDCLGNGVDNNQTVTNTFSISANNELQCQSSLGGQPQVLISGVEFMRVLFGEDTNGDLNADRYVPASYPGLSFNNVVSIRVGLILRTTRTSSDVPDTATYNVLGTTYGPIGDLNIRRWITTTIKLRNLMPNL